MERRGRSQPWDKFTPVAISRFHTVALHFIRQRATADPATAAIPGTLYQSTPAGRQEIQGFVGSLVGLGATKGVFVTTSSFSTPAAEYVRHLPQRVILIDGERLTELMIEHGVGVRVSRTIAMKRLDEDFFIDE